MHPLYLMILQRPGDSTALITFTAISDRLNRLPARHGA